MKFASFDSLNQSNKKTALLSIKDSPTKKKEDFFLTLHALLDPDSQVKLTAKLVYAAFQNEEYYLDLKGLSQEEIQKKVEEEFKELQGARPILIEWDGGIDQPVMAKNLQNRLRKAEVSGEWDGSFPQSAQILNSLREDTQGMIKSQLHAGEETKHSFIACYHEGLKPFRDAHRTLDSTTTVSVVNLSHFHFELPEFPNIQAMFSLLERPIYLLVLLTTERLIIFLRDQIRTSRASVQAIPFSQMKRVSSVQTQRGVTVEIETDGDLFKIPNLLSQDGTDLDRLLREQSISAIEADEKMPQPARESRELNKEMNLEAPKEVPPTLIIAEQTQSPVIEKNIEILEERIGAQDSSAEKISLPEMVEEVKATAYSDSNEAMEGMFKALDDALNSYKAAVRLGAPRSALIERWFTAFVNEIKKS
ncbi:MAG: hypothetical protein HQM08_15660 [Candidatus Riflebacteria bacterium]|nr:hypothetical protein [Candidatus Riflebacteria bacterium]